MDDEPLSETVSAPEDEWRLDGTITRADARVGVFWLQPDVLVLRDEDADLNLAGRARRIVVDEETLVWTPDGQTRPFGFNALTNAMRREREVSVVGVREGAVLRARLLVLPDLLPSNWRPEPFGAALRSRTATKPFPSRTTRPRPITPLAKVPAKPPVTHASMAKAPVAKVTIAPVPIAKDASQRPRLKTPLATAPAPTPDAKLTGAKLRAKPGAKKVRPNLAAVVAAPKSNSAARVVERPSLSVAAPSVQVPRGARTGTLETERSRIARAEPLGLEPRASRPPLLHSPLLHPPLLHSPLRPPSPPRVASAPGVFEAQVAPIRQATPSAPASESALIARGSAAAVEVAPRDVRREVEKQRLQNLRDSPPRASGASGVAWSAPAPLARAQSNAPQPRAAVEMRAPLFTADGRAIVRPPQLSTPTPESSSRLAQISAPLRRPPALSSGASQVLGGTTDVMQVLASGERDFLAARSQFARMKAIQDEIVWPDFSGGPGWDGALQGAPSRVAINGETSEVEAQKMIALTFDDGPHPNTRRVLDILDAHSAKATFFVVGRNVRRHAEILREVARRGHDIGNHSDQHVQGARLDARAWQREVDECNRAIADAIGLAPRWFRAPGCRYSMEALGALSSRNMVRVDSSNNSGDWHEPSPERIVARVLSRLAPGQVLLFHDPLPQTVRALPILLRELRARGFKCVTLGELARASAKTPNFSPPLRPPGQGIVLPPNFQRHRSPTAPQVLEANETLSADAPILLQVQP